MPQIPKDKPAPIVEQARTIMDAQIAAHEFKPITEHGDDEEQLVVTAPYVTYAKLVDDAWDPREKQVAWATAHRGEVLNKSDFDGEYGIAKEWDRLLRAHPEDRKPYVVKLGKGVSAQQILRSPAVGASTGSPDARATAIRSAVEATRTGLLKHLHPDDAEYPGPSLEDALGERQRLTAPVVPAGPGGYADDADTSTA